ncbi:ribonuclease domain-containing protein [Arenimonas terrae]|jgi:ribonuclease T1|uniref:Ribonuclease n=1 Tax=Arenimonas terrae TaxID=2546226 RepID=A0A5C4RTX4_9GAMM|nr:ribonuclease domain-containing protein [Arenimonas terrae]TNJ34773.1 ribonuclease [Arenimonas terrae]
MRKYRTFLVVVILLVLAWTWQQGEFAPAPAPDPRPSLEDVPASAPGPATIGPDSDDAATPAADSRRELPDFLPPEAADTLALIARGGPFPHRQDGSVFQNRERRLPAMPRGHYREYTVRSPGLGHRGPRRIVTGGDPPQDYWYTDDHYASFRRFEVPR